jgi:hypothetical protein
MPDFHESLPEDMHKEPANELDLRDGDFFLPITRFPGKRRDVPYASPEL